MLVNLLARMSSPTQSSPRTANRRGRPATPQTPDIPLHSLSSHHSHSSHKSQSSREFYGELDEKSRQRPRINFAVVRNRIQQIMPTISRQVLVVLFSLVFLVVLISALARNFFPDSTIAGASLACWGVFFGALLVAWPMCSIVFHILEFLFRFMALHTIAFYFEGKFSTFH